MPVSAHQRTASRVRAPVWAQQHDAPDGSLGAGQPALPAVLADAVLDHELPVPDVQVHPVPVDHQHRGISRVAGE